MAALLSRGNEWASDTDLVGHERPVVATRFCPTIFRKKDTGDTTTPSHPSRAVASPLTPRVSALSPSVYAASGGQKHSTLVALGDDNSGLLTIWSSVRSRPLLVVKDVFAGTLLTTLMLTSPCAFWAYLGTLSTCVVDHADEAVLFIFLLLLQVVRRT